MIHESCSHCGCAFDAYDDHAQCARFLGVQRDSLAGQLAGVDGFIEIQDEKLNHARFMACGWRRLARDMRNDRADGLALLKENDTLREAARVAEADAQMWRQKYAALWAQLSEADAAIGRAQMAADEYRRQRDETTERAIDAVAAARGGK